MSKYTDFIDTLTADNHDGLVVSIMAMLKDILDKSATKEDKEIFFNGIKEYFKNKGYIKTPLGWLPETKWLAMLSNDVVRIDNFGRFSVVAVKETVTEKGRDKVITKYPYLDWLN